MSTSTLQHIQRHTDTIANHFGFQEFNALAASYKEQEKPPKRKPAACTIPELSNHTNHLVTDGIRKYFAHELDAHTDMATYYTCEKSGDNIVVSFHIIGIQNSVAEALLLQTARSFLTSIGHQRQRVLINTIGDTDSKRKFTRELESFFRKNSSRMPEAAAKSYGKNIIDTYANLRELEHAVLEKSPRPIDCLNDRSRRHFREILDYLEISPTLYDMNPDYLGDYAFANGPLFTIELLDDNDKPYPIQPCRTHGGRYDAYTQKSFGRFTHGNSAVIVFDAQKKIAVTKDFSPKKHAPIYLIEIGLSPKMHGLIVLDTLLSANICVQHSIAQYTLSRQLAEAEASGAEYALIIGQHEVIHHEVIIRNMRDQSQITIPLHNLVRKLNSLLKI